MPKAALKAAGTADVSQEPQTVREKKSKSGTEATYTIKELVEASESALHVPKECAAAAFKFQKAERLSLMEAKSIVEKFMKKEVK